MLELVRNGKGLNLPKDVSINMVFENPFMLADRIPAPYSLTFDLEPTPGNLQETSHPDRVASVGAFEEIEGYSIRFNGVGFSSGTILVDKSSDKISVFYRGSGYIGDTQKRMYNVEMDKYTLDPCATLNEIVNQNGFYPGFKALLASAVSGSEHFVCGPVRIINDKQFDSIRGGDGSKMLIDFMRTRLSDQRDNIAQAAYINFWNVYLSAFRYGSQHMANGYFPRVGHVFDIAFQNTIANNVFNDGNLAQLIMLNFHNPMISSLYASNFVVLYGSKGCVFDNGLVGVSPYFRLNSSMPDYEMGKFLKDLLKLPCASLFPTGTGYEMALNKDILLSTDSEDWTPLLTGKPVISMEKGQTYAYGYNGVKDSKEEAFIYRSAHKDMYNIPRADLPVTCYITSTGEWYRVSLAEITDGSKLPFDQDILVPGRWYQVVDGRITYPNSLQIDAVFQGIAGLLHYGPGDGNGRVVDVSPDLYQFECINQGLGGNAEGDFQMTSDVSPLPQGVEKYFTDADFPIRFGEWLVPVIDEARYERPKTAHIALYRGLQKAVNNVDVYPYCSAHNIDSQGARIGDLSLAWDGVDGLLSAYHQEFKAWINKDRKRIQGYFRLSELTLRNLDMKKKKNVLGRDFFVEKIQVTLTKNSIGLALVDLIEC